MKELLALMLALAMLGLTACAAMEPFDKGGEAPQAQPEAAVEAQSPAAAGQAAHAPVSILPSPDKYTWYVQDYIGRNAAGAGYNSMSGERRDRYGEGTVKLIYVTEDGGYLDFQNEALLKQYVVTAQCPEPNTELKLGFLTDSDGEEYDTLISFQSIEVIELAVRRIDGATAGESVGAALSQINPSPDRYTVYIRNYVGKNLASIGYTAMNGNRMDRYGEGRVKFVLVPEDGSFIEPTDAEQLKQYYVAGQDVAPNSEMRLTYVRDSSGREYDNLIESQTYENITLYVKKLPDAVVGAYADDAS